MIESNEVYSKTAIQNLPKQIEMTILYAKVLINIYNYV